MRTEQEMMGLILGVAADNERVRAVVMNGSRADPNAPRDVFQDYDIVYFVTDLDSYIEDMSWVDIFGERMIMQMPKPDCGLVYLMQFTDGNRIDLTLASLSEKHEFCTKDKLAMAHGMRFSQHVICFVRRRSSWLRTLAMSTRTATTGVSVSTWSG